MNQNSQAHSKSRGEHKFDEKKRRQLIENICKVMEENGISKGAEILTDTLLKSDEDDYAERRKRKAVYQVVLIYVVIGIVITCGTELLDRNLNLNDIMKKILPYVPVIIESMIIIAAAWLERIKMPESTRFRQNGEGIAEGMINWAKHFGCQFTRASGLHVWILLFVTTLGSTLIAQSEPMKHIKAFISGGMYSMAHCDDNNNINDSVMLADGRADKISVSYEIKQYLAGADEKVIEQLDKAEVTGEQINMKLQLSSEDENSIFTCWGNGPDRYGTQDQMNKKVLSAVQGWCGEKLDNVFDREPEQGGASQKDKDEISRISESEKPDDSFSDVENRLDFRESIVKSYPKRTLTQLVANDYHGLALRLVWHEGVQSTIIYNYGQSILYNIECLKFADNTDKTIKERLTIIAQRYEDIAYVCPDYERVGEARSLAAAFRYAADQY